VAMNRRNFLQTGLALTAAGTLRAAPFDPRTLSAAPSRGIPVDPGAADFDKLALERDWQGDF
jgi:hypothetical protein